MNGAIRREREDALRADVARLVQAMHHHLPVRDVPPEIEPLMAPARHLAALLDADAPAGLLQEAALSVVDIYEASPDASGGDEGPVIDPAVLAAVERLRVAIDVMDEVNGDEMNGDGVNGADDEAVPPAGQAPA
jgi:hypothetical protein